VTRLSTSLFGECKELASVTLPKELSVIDTAAFGGCTKLTAITIPKKVTRINNYAFGRTGLTTVTIPASVKEMDTNPFGGCTELESINVEGGNSILSSIDGVLFSKDKATLFTWPQAKATKDYTVPNETKVIGDYAFYTAKNLTSIVLSEGVETVGEYAFYSAENLTSVTLPESITDLGENAFAYTRIQSIVVPDKVTELKDGVFGHTYLTDITLGKQMAVIHERALYASTMIQYMYIAATTPPLYPSRDGIYQTTLYVPKGAYDAYYAVSPWRSVSKIIESDSVVRFYPVSCTTEGGYSARISLLNRNSGYSTESDGSNFMSVIAGDSIRLYADGSGGYHRPPPIPIKQVFLNGVDVTEKNEESSRYIFRYNAKADGPLQFYILFHY
jgi:hypothetical protein